MRPGTFAHDPNSAVEETSSPAEVLVSGARAIAPVLLALIPIGVAFGATATESGLSALEALGMSVFIAAGAAQLAALPLLSAGASVAMVVLTVLVINLRLMLYSSSLAHQERPGHLRRGHGGAVDPAGHRTEPVMDLREEHQRRPGFVLAAM